MAGWMSLLFLVLFLGGASMGIPGSEGPSGDHPAGRLRGDQNAAGGVLPVRKTDDFGISGDGSATAWEKTDWVTLPFRKGHNSGWDTQVKLLYSDSGFYALFRCEDRRLSATMDADFLDLWNEDVAEIFLWPDERFPVYFEYEISPLNRELVLLVPNLDGQFLGWLPWHYEGSRRTRHATSVWGGEKKSLAGVEGWSAEVFIPYELLSPLSNVPPRPGTKWRANFYRCDYDQEPHSSWAWQPVEKRFHEFEKFGILEFK